MKLFIDTGDIAEVREAAALGVIDGVTTNPTLLAKAGRPIETAIREICEAVSGPVSAEVLATTKAAMVEEGRELARIHDNVVVKLPLTEEGLGATRILNHQGIRTNVTLCFSPAQALLAAKAGATYVSPFVGRLDDVGQDGMELIEEILGIYQNYDFETQVLVASVRHPLHVVQAARLGADVATLPLKVLRTLLRHPLTEAGLATFLKDGAAIPKG
jgi:transaldolase